MTALVEAHRREVGMGVAATVAAAYELTAEELVLAGERAFPEARRRLYAALRARGWSYPMIGRFVRRDHGTVHAVLNGKPSRRAR